ncbi:hypothetical protein F1C16_05195 [Hymenobacter sp. NBH84]|uniref:hypothetical protein n=1 Tax=Hymenobacter sp. NBH84 TaxID=2596915 RepID=UPI001626014D|nr:hypothetical protein [Hymenobacter sp. NBH84]QNE38991.1 hypothetical protein F1C16_05195 [Hymenobacter sp. NBH84]
MPTYDPILTIQKAVFKALGEAQINYVSTPISIYEFVPESAPNHYILLSQQSCIPGATSAARCKVWECTILLDIVTGFPSIQQSTSTVAGEIAAQVLEVLEGKRLELTNGFQMSPTQLIMSNNLIDNKTKDMIDVHRFLRFSFGLEQHQ